MRLLGTRLMPKSSSGVGNPIRTEILQRLRGGHALSRGYRSASASANDDIADWGSQSQYRGSATRRWRETGSQVYVPVWVAWLFGPACTLANCKNGTKFSGLLTSCKKLFNSRIGSGCCQGTDERTYEATIAHQHQPWR